MRTTHLLDALAEQDIEVRASGDQVTLVRSGRPVSAPEFENELTTHRAELLSRLRVGSNRPPQFAALPDRSQAPLSFAQSRLWFLDQLEPNKTHYSIEHRYCVRGRLDVAALESAFREVVRRHEVIRTRFAEHDGQPSLDIRPESEFAIEQADLRALPDDARAADAKRRMNENRARPFDLSRELMMRVALIRVGEDEFYLQWVKHHIASDAWSTGIFARELRTLYAAFAAGRPSPLPELSHQYADFAAWQRQWMQGATLDAQMDFWQAQLDELSPLELPTDYERPPTQRYRGNSLNFEVSAGLTAKLRALSQQANATLYMTLLAAFQTLLQHYSGQDDIAVGTPVANRGLVETEALIGFFINTLVMRTDLSGDPSFRRAIKRARRVVLDALDHQDLPFEKLVEVLKPERLLDRHPLFQASFQILQARDEVFRLENLSVERLALDSDSVRFDLEMTLAPSQAGGLRGRLNYSTDLFSPDSAHGLIEHYVNLLGSITDDPDQPISRLSLLSDAERRRLLVEWSGATKPAPRRACVHELFEEQVGRAPDAIAIARDKTRLTYRQLDQRANQLAHDLRRRGVGPRSVVGVCARRSPDAIVSLLAIAKNGCAYLPLDPDYPAERIGFMLADADARLVLTHSTLLSRLPPGAPPAVCLDLVAADIDTAPTTRPPSEVSTDDLIYVMYTSGSTGRPKGVPIAHRSVARLALGVDYLEAGWHESILQLSPLTFDASTFEIWGALLNGGRLVLGPNGPPDATMLEALIEGEVVRTAWLTATFFNTIVETRPGALRRVRNVLTGGEALSVRHVRLAQSALPGVRLVNGYGPTENTTFTCCFPIVEGVAENARSVPIGRPVAATHVYVLDKHGQPSPTGVIGELLIGGDGLSPGYLNQPDLTRERFVPHPFEAGRQLYRSGDLARWLPDGAIEFFGRDDEQVKVRGFRVEPGELAAALRQHPGVADCAVVSRPDAFNARQLVAYVAPTAGAQLNRADLRQFLRERLPEFMLPAHIVEIDRLPLNASGKLDRAALPEPEEQPAAPRDVADLPQGAEETALAAIWAEVLRLPSVGVNDDFFELGGHSLLASQLFARIEARTGQRLPLALVFSHPTVHQLAQAMRERGYHEKWNTLVAIQPVQHGDDESGGQARRPFFCVHGFGGGVVGYADLARALGDDQPFIGLQAAGLDGDQPIDATIESMAARYVKEMRQFQPSGPYAIGGYCLGGVVAFEMARQLEAQNQTVSLLAVIEGHPPTRRARNDANHARRFEAGRVAVVWRNIPFWFQDYMSLGAREILGRARRKLRRGARTPQHIADNDLSGIPEAHLELMRAHIGALANYSPTPIHGALTLFAARGRTITSALFGTLDPQLGWGALADGGVRVKPVDGGHRNLHLPPHVASLALALRESLDEAA